jgi:dihydroorotase-like cyclic amidohydrolase
MLQTKQEDITRAMCAQVINNRIDTIEIRRQPFVDTLKKVYPVECRAGAVGLRQRLSGYWSKCAEDMAFITTPVVDLLSGSLRRSPRFGLWPERAPTAVQRVVDSSK